ncbi:alpha/beta hydrolase [Amycolatopsis albispora]|uniref:Alpha/beta hydrolase n=1 Tax=Amycolatopsis albispora TaxID=1804986 RepID=A0A344LA01_9PSEU|nr:alpha/beta hydrolase [Amycolatopsis albispora]AXB44875.1 alpha/beta hydrolase [Amycolatopsis albispora]
MVRIGPNTKLPAQREAVQLRTEDGLRLVGELALPADRAPVATVVLLHPLPTHGGMMDSHVLRKAAFRLPALAGLAVLRFNTRGAASEAGRSEGTFGAAEGERLDVAAALDFARSRELPRVWLAGWSFGSDLALMHGTDVLVEGIVLIAPPLRWSSPVQRAAWASTGKPVVALVPEFDDYRLPEDVREGCAMIPQARVITLPGAGHLLVGHADAVLDHLVSVVAPETPVPLPRDWDGECEDQQVTIVDSQRR